MVNEVADENVARVVVLGRKGVGKTALIVRCLTRRFLPEYAPSKETVYRYKNTKNGKLLEMSIVDSDGQNAETYRSAEAFILVYSITSKRSFEALESNIQRIKLLNQNDAIIIIVANQIDLVQKREVTVLQGTMLADKLGVEHYQVSAASHVEEVINIFTHICQRIVQDPKKRKSQKIRNLFKRRGST